MSRHLREPRLTPRIGRVPGSQCPAVPLGQCVPLLGLFDSNRLFPSTAVMFFCPGIQALASAEQARRVLILDNMAAGIAGVGVAG